MPHGIVVAGQIAFWSIATMMTSIVLTFFASLLYNS